MGIYTNYFFPWCLDFSLGREKFNRLRQETLSSVQGDVLEIGFGTGLNLPFYPKGVHSLTVIDPNPGMRRRAETRISRSKIPIAFHSLKGERLPFPNQSFDSVVSTFTLCSVDDMGRVLSEIHRVLKKRGQFYILEHGLAKDSNVQKWQNRLTPLQKKIGDGCHLNRNMESGIRKAGFRLVDLKKFYLSGVPKTFGFIYQGKAEKEDLSL